MNEDRTFLKIRSILRYWLPLAAIAVVLGGLVYLAVQQDLRLGANDPQIQMAEDAASALAGGEAVQTVVPAGKVDLASSLAPFMLIFDDRGSVLASSGVLRNQIPVLPSGVLDYVRTHGEDRLSWAPEPGVRIAAVVTRYTGVQSGFVLAGRSLREVEKRVDLLSLQVLAAMLAALAGSLIVVILVEIVLHR